MSFSKKLVCRLMSIVMSCTVMLLSMGVSASNDAEVQPRIYENRILEVVEINQTYSNSCWAACSAMVLTYMTGTSVTESEVITSLYPNYNNQMYSIGSLQSGLANQYELVSDYSAYQYSGFSYPLYESEVMAQIATGKPILALRANHFVVIIGYEYQDNPYQGLNIYYLDPNQNVNSKQKIAYSEFCQDTVYAYQSWEGALYNFQLI